MGEGGRRLLWFAGLYLGGLAVFAAVVYALRGLMALTR
jgi:hypothetical protein